MTGTAIPVSLSKTQVKGGEKFQHNENYAVQDT